MRYSIIYAELRPEIAERISIGLIVVDGNKIEVLYSGQKLEALKGLMPAQQQQFVVDVVSAMRDKGTVKTVEDINYLSRYSNNLITVSPLRTIDVEATKKNKDRLYQNYIYNPENM